VKSHYCRDCGHQFNAPSDFDERMSFLCPDCKSDNWCLIPGKPVGNYGDKHDWSRETDPTTGLNGRYCPQMARYPGDPKAVVRHAKDIVEYGKRRGMKAEWHTT